MSALPRSSLPTHCRAFQASIFEPEPAQANSLRFREPSEPNLQGMKVSQPSSRQEPHRRSHPRLRLGIAARLETVHGTLDVDLIDLSQSGAKIDLAHIPRAREAVLYWLTFEAMGDIVWQEGELLGMTFEAPLSSQTIVATRNLAPSVVALDGASEAARAWATGVYERNAAQSPRAI